MCDRGLLELDSSLAKLEYCLSISKETQDKLVEGISKLIGQDAKLINPLPGNYPEDNPRGKNTVIVSLKKDRVHTFGDGTSFTYTNDVVRFDLKEMPGCCGILLSYHMQVFPGYEGKGIAKFLQEIKEDIARENGFTTMMCTTVTTNDKENHILRKSGWTCIHSFKNKRTSNVVLTWAKEL